ncbi:MAG TPA: hypothetical protein VJI32_02040 [Candidatus Nanoarchaeia archaeon]|nr:hypothetical protein [Candidatus Nanoarchaeia archaeon]
MADVVRSTGEPITLRDIILYSATGKPSQKYDTVTLSSEAHKDAAGSYIIKTQDGWVAHYAGSKERLPSLTLLYAVIEKLHEEKNPATAQLLKELKDSWLCTSTRIDYGRNIITHDYGRETTGFRGDIPKGSHWLKDITGNKEWNNTLQVLLMCKDVDKAQEVLGGFAGVPPYIWTADDRKSNPLRAAFVDVSTDRLSLDCSYNIGGRGCSRSVASE